MQMQPQASVFVYKPVIMRALANCSVSFGAACGQLLLLLLPVLQFHILYVLLTFCLIARGIHKPHPPLTSLKRTVIQHLSCSMLGLKSI